MQLIPIHTTTESYSAAALEVRVIMDNLYVQSPVKVYYSFYNGSGDWVGEGNLQLGTTLSNTSIAAMQDALETAVGTPETALLRMWQWGGNLYKFTYRLPGQEEDSIELEGAFITESDSAAIKAAVLTALDLDEVLGTASIWATAFDLIFG